MQDAEFVRQLCRALDLDLAEASLGVRAHAECQRPGPGDGRPGAALGLAPPGGRAGRRLRRGHGSHLGRSLGDSVPASRAGRGVGLPPSPGPAPGPALVAPGGNPPDGPPRLPGLPQHSLAGGRDATPIPSPPGTAGARSSKPSGRKRRTWTGTCSRPISRPRRPNSWPGRWSPDGRAPAGPSRMGESSSGASPGLSRNCAGPWNPPSAASAGPGKRPCCGASRPGSSARLSKWSQTNFVGEFPPKPRTRRRVSASKVQPPSRA